jgi:hypothetical protein
MSSMVLVCGTTVSHVGKSGQFPLIEIKPRDGVYATRPLFEAGDRPDEIVSSPMPNSPKLDAVAVADPFDDPEAKAAVRYSALYGDSARPYTPRCIPPAAIGGILVRPRMTAPAPLIFFTVNASSFATRLRKAGEPDATVMPSILYESLMVHGIPSKAFNTLPLARRLSEAWAASNAFSLMIGTALRLVDRRSYFAIRSKCFAVNSTLLVRPSERAVARSAIVASTIDES